MRGEGAGRGGGPQGGDHQTQGQVRVLMAVGEVGKRGGGVVDGADSNKASVLMDRRELMFSLQCKEDLIYAFPERKLLGLIPNFHIHVSGAIYKLYSQDRSTYIHILLQQNRQTVRGNIYISRTQIQECRNWERGHTVSFMGILFRIFGIVS